MNIWRRKLYPHPKCSTKSGGGEVKIQSLTRIISATAENVPPQDHMNTLLDLGGDNQSMVYYAIKMRCCLKLTPCEYMNTNRVAFENK